MIRSLILRNFAELAEAVPIARKQIGLSSPSRYFALLFVHEFVDKRDNPEQRWVFSLSLTASTLFYWECFENYHVLFWIRNSVLTYLFDMATVIKPYI